MTRYWYDTEFLEDGRTINLISIGIVADDGREYYAINRDMPWTRIQTNRWLMKNVIPSLPQGGSGQLDWQHHTIKHKRLIAHEVREFLLNGTSTPSLWAWYAAYDHVALCQLWGRMIDLPNGIPMWTNDLRQEAHRLSAFLTPQLEGLHNALEDARFNKRRHEEIEATEEAMRKAGLL